MRNTLLSAMALAVTAFSTSYAAFAGIPVVEDSYIVTFKKDAGLVQPPNEANRGKGNIPFAQHGTGQSKSVLAAALGTKGEVASIFEAINAIHIKTDANEAERLRQDKRVLRVDQSVLGTLPATQVNPGWGLDRLDSFSPALDGTYNYQYTGAGRTIYLLDSGIALSNPAVAAEFGGRASIIWDVNNGVPYGDDCVGHGTKVASIAGGNTLGAAKGATLIEAKITTGCTNSVDVTALVDALNWLAANAPKGTIVLVEAQFTTGSCSTPFFHAPLDNAVKAVHDAGSIVVVPAGNDGCNTADYSPVYIPQAFVVGATYYGRLPGADSLAYFSRIGWNISTFSPGHFVPAMDQTGSVAPVSGTSFSAPYIAGIFAVACQAAGTFCNSGDTAGIYTALRNTGTVGTVTNTDGSPLTGATPRFIWQQW